MIDFKIHKFEKFLRNYGAEILPITNEYELLRFKGKEVGVIYRSGKTSNGYTKNAINCFKKNLPWDGKPVNVGRKRSYRKEKIKLLERDGDKCFYCGLPLGEDITVEHLIALSSGGLNRLSNMVLAHEDCNHEVRNLPLNKKVKIAIEKRKNNNV